MATLVDNKQWGVFGSRTRNAYLTGDVSRSGNTVTLSNLRLHFVVNGTSGYADHVAELVEIKNGNTVVSSTTVYWTFSGTISNTVSLNNASVGVGTADTSHTFNLWAPEDNAGVNFTVTFPTGAIPPSGISVKYNSCTYNSVNGTTTITSWGTGTNRVLEQIAVNSSATPSNWTSKGRIVRQNPTNALTYTNSVSNATANLVLDGGITLKGCASYKLAGWANTSDGGVGVLDNTLRYLPPAQPSGSASDAGYTFTKRKVTITCAGAGTSSNYANTVTFYYRYKKSTDSNYGPWTSMGTGTATSSKSVTLTLNGSTTYNFQVLQQYQGLNSNSASFNYTTPAVPDQGILYAPVNGTAKRIRKLYGSVNGQTKEIKKLYGSVNGQSKRIF